MSQQLTGKCLCGSVRFTATVADDPHMHVCHCDMCRKWAGGVSMNVDCDAITFEGEDNLALYSSSDWGERGFCKICGTSLFWRMKDGSYRNMSAQAFDDPSVFKFDTEIFVDEQPANYRFANDTKRMTAAEVIAEFNSKQD